MSILLDSVQISNRVIINPSRLAPPYNFDGHDDFNDAPLVYRPTIATGVEYVPYGTAGLKAGAFGVAYPDPSYLAPSIKNNAGVLTFTTGTVNGSIVGLTWGKQTIFRPGGQSLVSSLKTRMRVNPDGLSIIERIMFGYRNQPGDNFQSDAYPIDTSGILISYEPRNSRWVTHVQTMVGNATVATRSTVGPTATPNTWYDFEIRTDAQNATFLINDEQVLSTPLAGITEVKNWYPMLSYQNVNRFVDIDAFYVDSYGLTVG